MGIQSQKSPLIRGLAMQDQLRFSLAITTPLAQTIWTQHQPSVQGFLAMSRAATAVALLSSTLKDRQQIGLQINGDGPLGELYAVSNQQGAVRVTVHNPKASVDPIQQVEAGIGEGRFTIIKTLASGTPYRGTVPIFTGGIAEDLAYYFMYSEQIPTACGLGEHVNSESEIVATGGYLVQALPNVEDACLQQLEANVLALPKLQDLLVSEDPLQQLLQGLFGDDYRIMQEDEVMFDCPCERTRYARALLNLGKVELTQLKEQDGEIQLECHFCASSYHFNEEELSALIYGAR